MRILFALVVLGVLSLLGAILYLIVWSVAHSYPF